MAVLAPLLDSCNRRIDYLRVSLTERCDLRCAYCQPRPRPEAAAGEDVLAADDVVSIAAAAAQLGIRRIRLTGGEPLLRADLEHIICRLRVFPGIEDISLTTNGQSLAYRAAGLAVAGLDRVNISLDSLDPAGYTAITGGNLAAVLRGLDAALAAGLRPVKANVVLTSAASLEQADLPAFLSLIRRRPVHVRFIEAMPTCGHLSYVPAQQVLARLSQMGELLPVAGPEGGGPARYYQLDGSIGTIGIITPISEPFCDHCNRLRVTARGDIVACLFSPTGISLLAALRGADPVGEVGALLLRAAARKPRCSSEVARPAGIAAMHVIGG